MPRTKSTEPAKLSYAATLEKLANEEGAPHGLTLSDVVDLTGLSRAAVERAVVDGTLVPILTTPTGTHPMFAVSAADDLKMARYNALKAELEKLQPTEPASNGAESPTE